VTCHRELFLRPIYSQPYEFHSSAWDLEFITRCVHLVLDLYLTEARCSPGIWHAPEFTRASVIDKGQVFVFPPCCLFWQWTCWSRHEASGAVMNLLNTYTTISKLYGHYRGSTSIKWLFRDGRGMWRVWGRGEGCTEFWWGDMRERDH